MAEDKGESGSRHARKKDAAKEDKPEENGVDEEPDFSDPEDYVDNATDDELLGDLLRNKPKETDGIDNVIVVDNVPQVGPERLEKLQNVIRKIFSKFGEIKTEFYPDADGKTKGYIFLEYRNPRDAQEAVATANGYKLDKQHTFIVNLFSDFDKYKDVPDTWTEPEPAPYKDRGNLRQWLLDPHCYNQYSVIYEGGEKTAIFLNTSEPSVLEERARWTETYARWSPQGTYFTTFHEKGIALWGGENFKQIMRFSHHGVQLIDYSPCEKYLVTFSPLADNTEDPQAIIIWDLRTGYKKRGFHSESAAVWPIFRWNHDGRYLARMTTDTLSVYETPGFGLMDKKSIKVKGLKDFAWSPTDNIISYWVPEERDTPARVTLIDIPSRKQLCMKNLFTVADCKMHWQKCGDYLCVKVDRYKSRKEEKDQVKYTGTFHNFNVFRIREKQIPVDIVEVKDNIMAFAWEPVGHKFSFIHGDMPRISVSFYSIIKGGNIELVKTLDKRMANHMFWSPNGQFLVLAGLRGMNGVLEFIDTSDMTVMAQGEHFMATDVEWDPTGRYVTTSVSWWGHKVDNAFWVWNFQGRILYKQQKERFCQFLWRPQPTSLLSAQQVKDLRKNMKKFNARFAVEDKMRESKASKEQIEHRRNQLEEFKSWRSDLSDRFNAERDARLELRDGVDTDTVDSKGENIDEETVEFLVKSEEILVDE
ncbi:Eukaryotic translation initiation factor 3 subunit B [Lamellibrachia satsuma]|nr:Eukaryotic translation initiation factor 3 subunit B [Lamellibrachia satsuma]